MTEKTSAPMSVTDAWKAVQSELQGLAKRDRNTIQNFNFRGIDAVKNAVGPVVRKHGVSIEPYDKELLVHEQIEVGSKRTLMEHVIIRASFVIVGPNGDEKPPRVVLGEAMDAGDKAIPKAESVAERTFYLQALCLPTDEPDPDAASYERAPKTEPEKPSGTAASDAQKKCIRAIADKLGHGSAELLQLANIPDWDHLTKHAASALIEKLKAEEDAVPVAVGEEVPF